METGIEESSDQESEPMEEPATVPAAVRKLADHFTGELSSVIPGRMRRSGGDDRSASNGEIDEGLSAFSGIYMKDRRNPTALLAARRAKSHPPIQEKIDHLIAVHATSTLPPGIFSLLPEEPSTIREAKSTPESPHWKGPTHICQERGKAIKCHQD